MGKAIEGVNWTEIQLAYQAGQGSCRELGEKYQISANAIEHRCKREKWREGKAILGQKVAEKVAEKVADKRVLALERHHSLVIPIAEKLIEGVQVSYDSMHGEPIDSAHLNGLAQTLKTANGVALLNLGFVQQTAVDVTSGGLSAHESALQVLASCRKAVADGFKSESIDIDMVKARIAESQARQA